MKPHEIVPLVAVGDVSFGESIRDLIRKGFKEAPDLWNEGVGWLGFERGDGLICYVEKERVVAISCSGECSFEGMGLIGLTLEEVRGIVKCDVEVGEGIWVEDDRQEFPVELVGLGIQLWLWEGAVVLVFCDEGETSR